MSLAYLNQESPMIDQDYERYTVNINGEITPVKWLKMGMSINATHSIQNYGIVSNFDNGVAKDSYGLARGLMPYAPAYDENGNILNPGAGLSQHNLLLNINEATNETRNYAVMFSSFAEVNILPWLKWRTNFGTQYRNSRQGSFYGENFTNPLTFDSTSPLTAYDNQSQKLSWTLENLIYINKKIGDKHSLGITLMQSAQKDRTEGLNVRAYGILYPTSMWYDVADSNKDKVTYGSNYNASQLASYMGRVNYSFMDRYLLTLTGRWDGASVLAIGNKWDFFPSAALAWKIDQEEWMKGIDYLSQLKVRTGYGVTGNSSVSAYQTSGSLMASNYVFGGTQVAGAKASVMPNVQLGWEKTASYNVGLDFGFLNNRISGSIEYYKSKTSDLLLSRSIPAITGYVSILSNVGETQNQGLEISLSSVNVKTKDFSWQTDFTFSTNKEKIVALTNGAMDDKTNGWFIGQPISVMRDYKFDRLWQNNDEDMRLMSIYKKISGLKCIPGQAKVVDQKFIEVPEGTEGSNTVTLDSGEKITYMNNGFGTINDNDNKILGSNRPKWVGGISNTLSYKNWQLNFFIYARIGNLYYGLLQTYGRRVENDVWSESNPSGRYPQPTTKTFDNYNYTMNYAKGNMITVRNIALSYTVPDKWLKMAHLSTAQVYGQVLNPFIFGGDLVKVGINPDDVTGWDSKTNGGYIGGQTNNTAIMRSYVIGLRFGF